MNLIRLASGLVGVCALLTCPRIAGATSGTAVETCETLSEPGQYDVVVDLTASGSCLDITGAGIVLGLDRHHIAGDGTGVGIHIESTASNFVLAGEAGTVSGFAIGIQDDAPGAWVGDFLAMENTVSGVGLLRAHGSSFYTFGSSSNPVEGVSVVATNGARIVDSITNNNGMDGILLAGSNDNILDFDIADGNTTNFRIAEIPAVGRSKKIPSSGNHLTDGVFENGQLGVRVNKGSGSNIIAAMELDSRGPSSIQDLSDGNSTCLGNLWFENGYKINAPACTGNPAL